MALCQWSDSMSVGESRLDADHKALIRLINRLHDGLEAGVESAALGEVFDSLLNYTRFHFTREEKVMRACRYPDAKAHEEEHAGFTRHIEEIRDRYARNADPALIRGLLDYLKDWLSHHILIQDMAYKPYVEHNWWAREVSRVFGPGLAEEAPADPARNASIPCPEIKPPLRN